MSNKDCKLLYSIGSWTNNCVTNITFAPLNGNSIEWTMENNTLDNNIHLDNVILMQSPIVPLNFPIFPLKVCTGDKFIFTLNNNLNSHNAFACAANIDGIIYRTVNNTIVNYPNKIILQTLYGFNIVNPSYSPITDLSSRNIIDTINYISVSPNNSTNYTLTWTVDKI